MSSSETDTEQSRALKIVNADEARANPEGVGHGVEDAEVGLSKLTPEGERLFGKGDSREVDQVFKDTSDLGKYIKSKAQASPIFQLSLGSKELFHSNFIAWTIDPNMAGLGRQFMALLFEDLVINDADVHSVARERSNIDLAFSYGIGPDQINFIIELKVKSVPYKHQLQQYMLQHPNAKKILICPDYPAITTPLVNDLNREYPDIEPWRVLTLDSLETFYQQLADTQQGYHGHILRDYAGALRVANQVAKTIFDTIKPHKPYSFQDDKRNPLLPLYRELRMHDMYLKGCYAMLGDYALEYLSEHGFQVEIQGMEREAHKLTSTDPNTVFIESAYTNAGLVGFGINLAPGLAFGIQIQNYQFRYFVEVPKGKKLQFQNELSIMQRVWFEAMERQRPEGLKATRAIKEVNSYGGIFIYRHFAIPGTKADDEPISIQVLMEAVFDSLTRAFCIKSELSSQLAVVT